MATLTVTVNHDYSSETVTNIDSIVFEAGATATFDSDQFGPGLIENDVEITGDGNTNIVAVNVLGGVAFSAASWTFNNWTPGDAVHLTGTFFIDTITGSDENDVLTGGPGPDTLNGGDGDDIFRYVDHTDATSGETVNGGDGTDTLEIAALIGPDFRNATLSNIEALKFTATTFSAVRFHRRRSAQERSPRSRAVRASITSDWRGPPSICRR